VRSVCVCVCVCVCVRARVCVYVCVCVWRTSGKGETHNDSNFPMRGICCFPYLYASLRMAQSNDAGVRSRWGARNGPGDVQCDLCEQSHW
jgi:hypothetical protein